MWTNLQDDLTNLGMTQVNLTPQITTGSAKYRCMVYIAIPEIKCTTPRHDEKDTC